MNDEEKAYLDKKFSEFSEQLLNPDPEVAWQRAKKYQKVYMKYYTKWIIVGAVLVLSSMAISFHVLGLL